MKYTYSEEEDGGSDALSTRQSNRHSGISTPVEAARPTFTASGRQVRSRYGGAYGEIALGLNNNGQALSIGGGDGARDDVEVQIAGARPGRATRMRRRRRGGTQVEDDSISDELDDRSDATSSGQEWDGNDDDEVDDHADDEVDNEEMNDDVSEDELAMEDGPLQPRSLVVSLRYAKSTANAIPTAPAEPENNLVSNGVSDQAPPPEANPFAMPNDIKAALPNGFTSATSNVITQSPPKEFPQQQPLQPYDKTRPVS